MGISWGKVGSCEGIVGVDCGLGGFVGDCLLVLGGVEGRCWLECVALGC